MSQTETEALLEVNDAFYRAIRMADLSAMNTLWSRGRRVSCTHPNGPALFGREAVMESWRLLFALPEAPQIRPKAPKAIVTGRTAMILCREDLGIRVLLASNIFVREGGGWLMVNHQAAHIPGTERH